jgi:hypothetical protein
MYAHPVDSARLVIALGPECRHMQPRSVLYGLVYLQPKCYLGVRWDGVGGKAEWDGEVGGEEGGEGYCLYVFAYQGMCFYAKNDNISWCQQKSVAYGWMKGRNFRPKQRALCQYCLDWLVGEHLADCMPMGSDASWPPPPSYKLVVAGRDPTRVCVLHDPEHSGSAPGLQRQPSTSSLSSLESCEILEDSDREASSSSMLESPMKKTRLSMPPPPGGLHKYHDKHEASAQWSLLQLQLQSQCNVSLRAKRTAEKWGLGYKGFSSTSGDAPKFVQGPSQVRVYENFWSPQFPACLLILLVCSDGQHGGGWAGSAYR